VVILLCSSSLADYLYILIFFPTRRSSDLWLRERPSKERGPDQRLSDEGDVAVSATDDHDVVELVERLVGVSAREIGRPRAGLHLDRKSTRLNSSHVKISYAVFCLKKKNLA